MGIGLVTAVLLPIALVPFGVVTLLQSVSAVFLLAGSWKLIFGLAFVRGEERVHEVKWGVGFALLSTFAFIPLQYAAGLVALAMIGAAAAARLTKPRPQL